MMLEYTIQGGDFSRAGSCSSAVKKVLKQLNIAPEVVKKMVVALYEAEVNVVAHAWEGNVQVDIDDSRILCRVVDRGPGIEDIDLAMQEGYSTASEEVREMGFGAGMGLPNIRKNTKRMNLNSIPGQGTALEFEVRLKEESL